LSRFVVFVTRFWRVHGAHGVMPTNYFRASLPQLLKKLYHFFTISLPKFTEFYRRSQTDTTIQLCSSKFIGSGFRSTSGQQKPPTVIGIKKLPIKRTPRLSTTAKNTLAQQKARCDQSFFDAGLSNVPMLSALVADLEALATPVLAL
jgi:hypothetical protein